MNPENYSRLRVKCSSISISSRRSDCDYVYPISFSLPYSQIAYLKQHCAFIIENVLILTSIWCQKLHLNLTCQN